MARQPLPEIEKKAVVSITFAGFRWPHPFRQPEPKDKRSRQQCAVSENQTPHHCVAESRIDRSRRLDDLHRLVEKEDGEYYQYEGGNDQHDFLCGLGHQSTPLHLISIHHNDAQQTISAQANIGRVRGAQVLKKASAAADYGAPGQSFLSFLFVF
jgi:hypothetical protein